MNIKARYFNYNEFNCKCCGENITSEFLIQRLDIARFIFGNPITITSGYRCENHNTDIGGKTKSSHIRGLAADISCLDDFKRFSLLLALLEAGFTRIGIYPQHIHVDIDVDSKAHHIMWAGMGRFNKGLIPKKEEK